jgi:HlyD family secretion protein
MPMPRGFPSLPDRFGALRSPWVKRILLAAVVLGVGGYVFRDALLGTPVVTAVVARGDIVQTVVASGRVMTPQRVSLSAVYTDRVVRIPVEEGQRVKRGDVLVVLDDADERAALAQARAAVAQAEARIRQVGEVALPGARQALALAQANLLLAQQQFDRAQDLKAKGFVSQAALDDARRNLDVARSQLESARIAVSSNGPAGSDYLVAQTALAQARATVEAAQARLDQSTLRAPVDGTLIGRSVEPGDVVQPGKELMVLAPSGETQVVVQIDEKNLAQLRVGQSAWGSADAYPRERFLAELVYINPGIDALRGSVEVKLRVSNPPAYLRQDMTASIDIEVGRHADVLVVPSGAIFDSATTKPWVLLVEGRRAVKRPVTLGLKGSGSVEVVAGLAAGETVVAAAGPGVLPGQRIRPEAYVSGGS